MNANENRGSSSQIAWRGWALAALLAAGMILGSAAWAQSGPTSTPAKPGATSANAAQPQAPAVAPAPAKSAIAPAAKPRGGGEQEGIKVHGHWTIVVKNPDGTVTDRREFENSLGLGGVYLMAGFAGGTYVPGAWAISLGQQLSPAILPSEQYSTGPCGGASFLVLDVNPYNATASPTSYNPNTSQGNCFIGEPSGIYSTNPGVPCSQITGCSPTLTREAVFPVFANTTPTMVATPGGFQLTGTAVATQNGTIDTVSSEVMYCFNNKTQGITYDASIVTTDPGSCDAGTPSLGSVLDNESAPLLTNGKYVYGGATPVGQNFSATVLNGASSTSNPPAPVNVVAHQTVQVTVLFSFN